MDTITHLLLGHVMGVAAGSLGTAPPNAVYWALVVGNSLPDIDVPLSLLLRGDIKLHRTFTHTVPGAAILSLGAALLLATAVPGANPGVLFLWTLAGALTHIGMDALNLFGVKLFGHSRRPTAAGILHILDPVLLALLAAGSISFTEPLLAAAGLVASAIYIAWRGLRGSQIRRHLRDRGAVRADLIPWYAGWRYVAEGADQIEYGRWSAKGPVALETYPRLDNTLVSQLGRHSQVQTFLARARYPYAIIHADEVVWGCALHQIRSDYRPLRLKIPCSES